MQLDAKNVRVSVIFAEYINKVVSFTNKVCTQVTAYRIILAVTVNTTHYHSLSFTI